MDSDAPPPRDPHAAGPITGQPPLKKGPALRHAANVHLVDEAIQQDVHQDPGPSCGAAWNATFEACGAEVPVTKIGPPKTRKSRKNTSPQA